MSDQGQIAALLAKHKLGKKAQDDDDGSNYDDDEVLDEDFSASDDNIPVHEDEKDDDYSINDDDFNVSTSFKQKSPLLATPGANGQSANKDEYVSAAQQRMNQILEEEQKAKREKEIREIMKKQKEEMRQKLGADSDDDESDDYDDGSDEGATAKPSTKTGAKNQATQDKNKQKLSQGYNYFMKQSGKEVEESSEVEFSEDENSKQQSVAQVDDSYGNSFGTSLQDSKPKQTPLQAKAKPAATIKQRQDEAEFSRDDYDDFDEDDQSESATPQATQPSPKPVPVAVKNKEKPMAQQTSSRPKEDEISQEVDEEFDEEFEESQVEKADQSRPIEPEPVQARPVQSRPVVQNTSQQMRAAETKLPTPPESEPEEVINDFEEESIQDEQVSESQAFSVHEAAEESRDKVMQLQVHTAAPGNSTVNMASVVPQARIQQSMQNEQTFSPQNQTQKAATREQADSSPMFVKGPPATSSPEARPDPSSTMMEAAPQNKPGFVKHVPQEQKKISIKQRNASSKEVTPSPERKRREEDEINQQLKQIRPRYPMDQASSSQYGKPKGAVRPQTAMPSTQSQARTSSNNRDLTKVSVAQKNNFLNQSKQESELLSRPGVGTPGTASSSRRPQSGQAPSVGLNRNRPGSAIPDKSTGDPAKKVERVNYAEVSLRQPPDEKKFFKYEPKKSKHINIVAPKPVRKPKPREPEVVVDEAATMNDGQSRSPEARTLQNSQQSAIPGLAPLTMSTIPGLSQGIMNAMQKVSQSAVSAAEKKKAAATKPGSAWGSRVVPDKSKHYELPQKVKPKVKEETKKALSQKSRLGVLKKEEAYVKEKNPPIVSHKVAKKPPTADGKGQENSSANKPRGASQGGTGVVVHGSKLTQGSPNTFDFMAENKRQQQQASKGKKGKKQTGPGLNFGMPAKNLPFSSSANNDLDPIFQEGDIEQADQGAPPVDDEFAEAEIDAGDQNMNMGGDEDVIFNEEDEVDQEADAEDKEFLKEIDKPKVAKKASRMSQQSAKREQGWAGNGLGSGSLQQQKKQDDAQINRKNINMAVQPTKKEAAPKPIPWGFNPLQKTKQEVNKEEQEQKKQLAQERFKDIQHQKKEAARNANPSLNVFMAQMAQMDKIGKKDAKQDAVNPLVKNAEIKAANPNDFLKSGIDRVPAEASKINDVENTSKLVSDLQKELKQLFFENKQANKQVQQFERKQLTASTQLENMMTERNLIKVNGKLEAKTEVDSAMKRILRAADIPDYDKIKDRANPMEPVVAKFAERGFTPLSVFTMLDIEDEDDILTFSEIKNGLKRLKIDLLDSEWQMLFKAIDKDGDNTVTLEEWQEILQPKLNAQREFMNIMKDLNINDPLILEEQILDVVYQKRRLAAEVKVMRSTKNKEQFFKKQKIEQEQKAMAKKIQELQDQVKNSRNKTEEEKETFDEKMKSGLQTKAEVEAEFEKLTDLKRTLQIEQGSLEELHRRDMLAADQLFHEVNQYAIQVKQDRDRSKLELKKMEVKRQMMKEAEAKLDKELESILGRAITMEDLEALYQMDLKLLGSIEAGLNNKIGSLREIIMARYVQKAWRGYCARKRVKELRAKRKAFQEKYNVFCDKMKGKNQDRAARVVARRWRAFVENRRRNAQADQAKHEMELAEKQNALLTNSFTERERKIAERAAINLQKNWRAFVARREFNKKKGKATLRFGQKAHFDALENVALHQLGNANKKKNSRALGTYNHHEQKYCLQCDEKIATRQCLVCEYNLFCTECYTESHMIGGKKRHLYFDLINNSKLPEGPSTWSQPVIKEVSMDDIPERENSFILMSEDYDDESSSSFERVPGYDANTQYHQMMGNKNFHVPHLIPNLNFAYGDNSFFGGSSFFRR